VATRSFKRDAVWRIDFKKKGDFRQKIWQSRLLAFFRQKKRGAAFQQYVLKRKSIYLKVAIHSQEDLAKPIWL
jgi:hypothetical protein